MSLIVDEWASSLHHSRLRRYTTRATSVRTCMHHHTQHFQLFAQSLLQQRRDTMQLFDLLHGDITTVLRAEHRRFRAREGFLSVLLGRLRLYSERASGLLTRAIKQVLRTIHFLLSSTLHYLAPYPFLYTLPFQLMHIYSHGTPSRHIVSTHPLTILSTNPFNHLINHPTITHSPTPVLRACGWIEAQCMGAAAGG